MFCEKCGAKLGNDAKFCRQCGNEVDVMPPEATQLEEAQLQANGNQSEETEPQDPPPEGTAPIKKKATVIEEYEAFISTGASNQIEYDKLKRKFRNADRYYSLATFFCGIAALYACIFLFDASLVWKERLLSWIPVGFLIALPGIFFAWIFKRKTGINLFDTHNHEDEKFEELYENMIGRTNTKWLGCVLGVVSLAFAIYCFTIGGIVVALKALVMALVASGTLIMFFRGFRWWTLLLIPVPVILLCFLFSGTMFFANNDIADTLQESEAVENAVDEVKILDITVYDEDIVITYEWTNLYDDYTAAQWGAECSAYQGNVKLNLAYIFDDSIYDASSKNTAIAPNTSIECQSAFSIQNDSEDIQIEFSKTFDFTDAPPFLIETYAFDQQSSASPNKQEQFVPEDVETPVETRDLTYDEIGYYNALFNPMGLYMCYGDNAAAYSKRVEDDLGEKGYSMNPFPYFLTYVPYDNVATLDLGHLVYYMPIDSSVGQTDADSYQIMEGPDFADRISADTVDYCLRVGANLSLSDFDNYGSANYGYYQDHLYFYTTASDVKWEEFFITGTVNGDTIILYSDTRELTLKQINGNLVVQSYTASEYEDGYDSEDNAYAYLYPGDSQYITFDELDWYTQDEILIIRNEIYARHGYTFSNEELRNYFNNQPWYYPVEGLNYATFDQSVFNDIEKTNLETIVEYEAWMGW